VDQCVEDLDSLPIIPAARIQLLRILQEGLTNVRRHANASWIIVAITCADGWLILHILDDGTGFDLHNIPDDRLGLRIMRERAASAGGAIAITSQIGKGTQLEIKIPLRISQNLNTGEL
jgi:NarL family two-component system sensor histidine kinase LiaS